MSSDGTTIALGGGGDTIFDEDVSADAVGGFAGKIQGVGIFHGARGALGRKVSEADPLPTKDDTVVDALEDLREEFQAIREHLEDDNFQTVFDLQDPIAVVRDGYSIAFGSSAATSGYLRFPSCGSVAGSQTNHVYARDHAGTNAIVFATTWDGSADTLALGDPTYWDALVLAANADVIFYINGVVVGLVLSNGIQTAAGTNIGVGSAGGANYQSMTNGIYMANAVIPTGNPSGGGFLYVDSGALKYRGSSGTVTPIANA